MRGEMGLFNFFCVYTAKIKVLEIFMFFLFGPPSTHYQKIALG
jgi:hypothetical protein